MFKISCHPDQDQIIIFGTICKFKWLFISGYGKDNYIYDSQNKKLTIFCDLKHKENPLKLKTILIATLKDILLKYIIDRQTYFSKIMNVEDSTISSIGAIETWTLGANTIKRIAGNIKAHTIRYSGRLICFDKEIIDAVIIHELGHNKHRNHSRDFWNFLESCFNGYIEYNKTLNKIAFTARKSSAKVVFELVQYDDE
ncbi:M48 family metallopeptidase [Mycoplasma sp. Pen4]|uniref:M48 family metallopeptidase n=1 Tax=Mycoplasma sp. Pen4 TaxID=640330 RepID=UPI00165464F7|nr:M48 family metallopeptidase [Mycoplasma sp. Pen4]QNM93747.1 M48 family metallopeptidase [Mycoplasma sp. Pen4]